MCKLHIKVFHMLHTHTVFTMQLLHCLQLFSCLHLCVISNGVSLELISMPVLSPNINLLFKHKCRQLNVLRQCSNSNWCGSLWHMIVSTQLYTSVTNTLWCWSLISSCNYCIACNNITAGSACHIILSEEQLLTWVNHTFLLPSNTATMGYSIIKATIHDATL